MLYIYLPNAFHSYGFVLESNQRELNEKFIDFCRTKIPDYFSPFWQSGSDNVRGGFQYFELLSFGRNPSDERIEELFKLGFELERILGIPIELGRPTKS